MVRFEPLESRVGWPNAARFHENTRRSVAFYADHLRIRDGSRYTRVGQLRVR